MNVETHLTCKANNLEEDSLEGVLVFKGNLSDLIKIMEAVKLGHLHPAEQEEYKMVKFCEEATKAQRTYYVYDGNRLHKIACIKAIREAIPGTTLKDAKSFIEGSEMCLRSSEVNRLREMGIIVIRS